MDSADVFFKLLLPLLCADSKLRSGRRFIPWRLPSLARAVGVAALTGGWGAATVRAELTWKEKTVEIKADATADVLEARFRFTNDGATPVDIRQIDPSCGCTTVALEQRHYAPGQGGEIVVRYTIGDHVGLQKKSILVSTGDRQEATILTLVARVPELLHVAQPFVTWKHDEAATEKTISLVAAPNTLTPENLSLHASNGAFATVLQPATDGSGYALRITPGATDKPLFTTLTIHCRVGKVEKTVRAYATVEQGPSPARRTVPAAPAPPGAPDLKPVPPLAAPAATPVG